MYRECFQLTVKLETYQAEMVDKFDDLLKEKNYPWKLEEIFPKVLFAGEKAGVLTEEGAKLLDESGQLEPGIPLCPPEGDAGTGMVATNSVGVRTGNVSAGTSVFAMIVLEKALSKVYPEIDMVTTPDGYPVAMVHANNCTSDLNAWVELFREFAEAMGMKLDMDELYGTLYRKALEGDKDCGGLLSYGFLSGEFIMGITEGRPMFVRTPDSHFNLANFMRSHLYAALGALKVGMDILNEGETVSIDKMTGHGGLFKTEGVGQKIMAAAVKAPVSVMETAGEGGPWGEAILAAYMVNKAEDETLQDYLNCKVFADAKCVTIEPNTEDTEGLESYISKFKEGIEMERIATKVLH